MSSTVVKLSVRYQIRHTNYQVGYSVPYKRINVTGLHAHIKQCTTTIIGKAKVRSQWKSPHSLWRL